MHISSALTLVRRAPAQSAVPESRDHGRASPVPAPAKTAWARKALPGGVVLTLLAILGALFPIVF